MMVLLSGGKLDLYKARIGRFFLSTKMGVVFLAACGVATDEVNDGYFVLSFPFMKRVLFC